MISGRIATTVEAMIRTFGFSSSSLARSSEVTSRAAAPSLSGQALPAVTVPSGLKAGFRAASFSTVVPARGPSSLRDDLLGHVDLVALAVLVLVGGRGHRDDLDVEVARFLGGHGARCEIAAHSS